MKRYFRYIFVATVLFAAVLLSFAVTGASAKPAATNQGTIGTTLIPSGTGFDAKQGTVFTGLDPAQVAPNQGTIGTTFTIAGTDFGAKRGAVFIGQYPAQVLTWSDTQIDCMVKVPMSPGTYDLVVNPQGKASRLTLYGAFSIMPPTINSPKIRPVFVSPGQQITIGGTFFGSKNGRRDVEIETLNGEKAPCEIVDWQMDSITVKLPEGIPGRFNLEVTNAMGTAVQDWWGTFAPSPDPQMLQDVNYTGAKAHRNATAVSYQNKLWVFWPGEDSYIYYKTWDGENWSATEQLIDTSGSQHRSYAPLNLVVINGTLYLFETRVDANIHVTKYNPWRVDPTDPTKYSPAWINQREIPVTDYTNSGRFAAVYNSHTKLVEIYITTSDSTIDWVTYDPSTNQWSNKGPLPIHGVSAIKPYLSAVFNGNEIDPDYITYLAWADGAYYYLTELRDGVVLHQYQWNLVNASVNGVSLVDLGEKYLAIMYNKQYTTDQYSGWFERFDKESNEIISVENVPFISNYAYSSWVPTGVVYSTKVAANQDDEIIKVAHMDTKFYAFVANRPHDYIISSRNYTTWQFTECSLLGYWVPGESTRISFYNDAQDSTAKDDNAKYFPLWPVVGLIDMPPFVLNGNPYSTLEEYTTSTDFIWSSTSTLAQMGNYSVGAYIETGEKSPVTEDVSLGFTGGYTNSKTFSYSIQKGIDGTMEGEILGIYLIPSFTATKLTWYDLNGSATDRTTIALQAEEPEMDQESFDPEFGPGIAYDSNGECYFTLPYLTVAKTAEEIAAHPYEFPMHASDNDRTRLATFQRDPTIAPYTNYTTVPALMGSVSWSAGSGGTLDWQVTQSSSVDHGFYCDVKIGANVPGAGGFGVEGHFDIHVNTQIENGLEVQTHFKSRWPYVEPWTFTEPPIKTFHVTGFWLKPDASGYWVPNNRRGMGDAPWFVTYKVSGIEAPVPWPPQ